MTGKTEYSAAGFKEHFGLDSGYRNIIEIQKLSIRLPLDKMGWRTPEIQHVTKSDQKFQLLGTYTFQPWLQMIGKQNPVDD